MGMLNRKWRSDATWNKLNAEQVETVDGWLFDERLAYAEIVARVEKEFGLKSTVPSLSLYYRRRATERQGWELVEARETAEQVNGLAGDPDAILAAVMNLAGKAAVRSGIEEPDQLKTLVALTKVLLEREKNNLRRHRLDQWDRQFDYEAAQASLSEMPQFRAFVGSIEDDKKLSAEEKTQRIHEFLFGWKRQEEERQREKEMARKKTREAAEQRLRAEVEEREEKQRREDDELRKSDPEAYRKKMEYREMVKRNNEKYIREWQERLAAEKRAKENPAAPP